MSGLGRCAVTTTALSPTEAAKDSIDAMIRLVRSHAADRDPVAATVDHLLDMRAALDLA